MIRIVIICEKKEEQKRISELLSANENFQIICIGSDGYDALKSAADLRPDIFIMDMRLAGIDAPELAPLIKRRSPSSALIALSSRDEDDSAQRAIRAGISGYLLKQDDMDILVNLVNIVFHGGYFVSTPIMNRFFDIISNSSPSSGVSADNLKGRNENSVIPDFSPTERQIITGIAQGYSDMEIAEYLHINPGTVRNCMSSAKRKTGFRNRAQVVIQSVLRGLIRLPPSNMKNPPANSPAPGFLNSSRLKPWFRKALPSAGKQQNLIRHE